MFCVNTFLIGDDSSDVRKLETSPTTQYPRSPQGVLSSLGGLQTIPVGISTFPAKSVPTKSTPRVESTLSSTQGILSSVGGLQTSLVDVSTFPTSTVPTKTTHRVESTPSSRRPRVTQSPIPSVVGLQTSSVEASSSAVPPETTDLSLVTSGSSTTTTTTTTATTSQTRPTQQSSTSTERTMTRPGVNVRPSTIVTAVNDSDVVVQQVPITKGAFSVRCESVSFVHLMKKSG